MASSQTLPPPASTDYASQASPLNASLYDIDEEFLSTQTGIKDREELKQHVLKVQADAYAVYPYPCIKTFEIAKSKINKYSAYRDLLKLAKERPGAIFLDVGCCVGNDTRRAIQDGFPADQVVATDLHGGFWDVGHQLFKSTPETFPVKFLPGNIFDSAFFEPQGIPAGKLDDPNPTLASLTNLTPLNGRVSAIHASLFFHLFDEEHQLKLAKLFASLLSAEPGSMIFGSHSALPEKGLVMEKIEVGKNHEATRMFCHSPESWKELWEGVLGKDKVEVKATLVQIRRKDWELRNDDTKFWLMVWSVKRV